MILPLTYYPDPRLRKKGTPVKAFDAKLKQLAADMLETMESHEGVGLAAQQVGIPMKLTVLEVEATDDRPSTMTIDGKEEDLANWMPLVLLDPVLELGKERESGTEGCLSFPEITAEIERAAWVKAKGRLLDGREIEFEATGLLARALQHETDHLNGILFIDRMKSATKIALKGKLKRLQRETQG